MQLQYEKQIIYALIDDLKAICSNYGLGNSGNEYKIITETFLYKFLNDKFLAGIKELPDFQGKSTKEIEQHLAGLSEEDFEFLMMDLLPVSLRRTLSAACFPARGKMDSIRPLITPCCISPR